MNTGTILRFLALGAGIGGLYLFINDRSREIMATIQQIEDAVAEEVAEVKGRLDELEAEVKRLTDIIAAGGTVTEAQLDGVLDKIRGIYNKPAPTEG